jgi:hypothetical protein
MLCPFLLNLKLMDMKHDGTGQRNRSIKSNWMYPLSVLLSYSPYTSSSNYDELSPSPLALCPQLPSLTLAPLIFKPSLFPNRLNPPKNLLNFCLGGFLPELGNCGVALVEEECRFLVKLDKVVFVPVATLTHDGGSLLLVESPRTQF